ncbi:hypothetical protein Q8A73_021862 [Channa argus]|nr:hypothetical protein Q8A73_021862 [Channa argus]
MRSDELLLRGSVRTSLSGTVVLVLNTNRGMMDEQTVIEKSVVVFGLAETVEKLEKAKGEKKAVAENGVVKSSDKSGEGRERGSKNETDKQRRYPAVLCQPFPYHPYCIPSS